MKIAFVSTAIVLVGLLGNVVVADAQNTCPDCIAAGCVACGGMNSPAYAMNYGHCGPRCQASLAYPWNCGYYYTQWGSPVALVVPPTAERQYSMGWGSGKYAAHPDLSAVRSPVPGQRRSQSRATIFGHPLLAK